MKKNQFLNDLFFRLYCLKSISTPLTSWTDTFGIESEISNQKCPLFDVQLSHWHPRPGHGQTLQCLLLSITLVLITYLTKYYYILVRVEFKPTTSLTGKIWMSFDALIIHVFNDKPLGFITIKLYKTTTVFVFEFVCVWVCVCAERLLEAEVAKVLQVWRG